MVEVFVLVDGEYGDVNVFHTFEYASSYYEEIDSSSWIQDATDDTFWYLENVDELYIFKREIK